MISRLFLVLSIAVAIVDAVEYHHNLTCLEDNRFKAYVTVTVDQAVHQ